MKISTLFAACWGGEMKEHGRSRCKVSRIIDMAGVNQASGRGSRQEINLPRGLVVIDLHI
jgi:hypothetical protein